LNIYKKFVTDWPDIDQRWNITIRGEVVFTTPAVTSLALSIQSYAGGAHGYSEKTYISFNTETSEKIRLSDIISDEKKLVEIAEKKFRILKKLRANDDLKTAGFGFEKNKFSLNDNYCITDKGLSFYYNEYEINSYAMGTTELVLTYEELDTIIVRNILSY
jgi:predicted transcriptional regulator